MNPILPPGTTLKNNTYEIIRLLGQGGFGAVYLAEDLMLNKRCAVKESFDTDPGAQRQFELEARILANLSHPHLPRVTDNFIEQPSGKQYLVMEYVEGENLLDIVERQGPLPEAKVLAWMDQVLSAVEYLHTYKPRPVIHRDIKLDNIILLPDGKTVKLVDFGIAKIGGQTDKTRAAARGVTPGMSPPEQYTAGGTDTYSDVYALGGTLYALLTAQMPPESIHLLSAGARLIPPRHHNPKISPRVEGVILQAMNLKPRQRYPTAKEMRLVLQGKPTKKPATACPHCGARLRAGAKFCTACGKTTVPPAPFVFKQSGYRAKTVKELVRGCDSYWAEAEKLFWRGKIDAWLTSIGQRKLAGQAKVIRARHSDRSAALEAFLQAAAPTRSLPVLTLDRNRLDFGALRIGNSKAVSFVISNSGRGYLYGSLNASPPAWLTVHPANFGCLAGKQQKVNVEINTANLSGTELGVDYNGTVTVLSNRGQQTLTVRVKVVDEPQVVMDPQQVNLGKIAYGQAVRRQVRVANKGGGTLQGNLRSLERWIAIEDAGRGFSLRKGHSTVAYFSVRTEQLPRKGDYTGQLQVQSNGGNPVVAVSVTVDVPFSLNPADPASQVSSLDDLCSFCDANWEAGIHHLYTGCVEAFLSFIEEVELARQVADCRQIEDRSVGLETSLRAVGARPPTRYDTNVMDVVSALGFGLLPRLRKRPDIVMLAILNKSKRGYLHGRVEPLVPWLAVPAPAFGCLPGEVAEVEIHADYKQRKTKLFSLGEELFEIVVE